VFLLGRWREIVMGRVGLVPVPGLTTAWCREDCDDQLRGSMKGYRLWLRAEWDRVVGFSALGLGVLALGFGYRGVANSSYVIDQLAYLASGGLGGLFCLGVAAIFLMSADMHDEWRKLNQIYAVLVSEKGATRETPGETGRDRTDEASCVPEEVSIAGHAREVLLVGDLEAPLKTGSPKGARFFGRARAFGLASTSAFGMLMVLGWHAAAGSRDAVLASRGLAVAVGGLLLASVAAGCYLLWLRRKVQRLAGGVLGALAAGALFRALRSESARPIVGS
jgi:hypothetical protein